MLCFSFNFRCISNLDGRHVIGLPNFAARAFLALMYKTLRHVEFFFHLIFFADFLSANENSCRHQQGYSASTN
jgi:hypothetical protein